MKISKIAVKKLFGTKDFSLELQNGRGIFYGENGAGKTTFLNLVFSVFKGDMNFSKNVQYESLTISFEGAVDDIVVGKAYKWINQYNQSDRNIFSWTNAFVNTSKSYVQYIQNNKVNFLLSEEINWDTIINWIDNHNINIFKQGTAEYDTINHANNILIGEKRDNTLQQYYSNMLSYLNSASTQETNVSLQQAIFLFESTQNEIMYLNVYRNRPELIERYRNNNEANSYEEGNIISVSPKLSKVKEILKSNLDNATRMITNAYKNMSVLFFDKIINYSTLEPHNFTREDILDANNLFQHLKIVDETNIKKIKTLLESQVKQESYQYFAKSIVSSTMIPILNDYRNNIKPFEVKAKRFVNLINSYLKYKEVVFEVETVNFYIIIDGKKYELSDKVLSSGEKNIITIFANLIFNNKQNIHMLIDEPELSLSIQWQEKFIEDISNFDNVKNMIVVTHSPYVVSENLINVLKEFGSNE